MTFYHAIDVTPAFAAGEFVTPSVIEQIETGSHKQALKRLAEAAKAAQAASVPCETLAATPQAAYRGIVDAVRRKKCDVIFMASHGRESWRRSCWGA